MTADDGWAIIEISDIRFPPRVDFLLNHATALRLIMLSVLQYGGNVQFDLILPLLYPSVCETPEWLLGFGAVGRIAISVVNVVSC